MIRCFFFAVFLLSSFLPALQVSAQTSSPEDFEDCLEAWKGRWVGYIEKDGVKKHSFAKARLIEEGKGLLVELQTADSTGTWMVGYDAGRKSITTMWISSTGEMGRGVLYKDGSTWVNTGEGSTADGEASSSNNVVRITDSDKHNWTFELTVGDEVQSWTSVWERVAK